MGRAEPSATGSLDEAAGDEENHNHLPLRGRWVRVWPAVVEGVQREDGGAEEAARVRGETKAAAV